MNYSNKIYSLSPVFSRKLGSAPRTADYRTLHISYYYLSYLVHTCLLDDDLGDVRCTVGTTIGSRISVST